MDLIIATRNVHKLEEIRAILGRTGLVIGSALDFPDLPDVEETGTTFEENAALKALALATATRLPALGDDSGLEVDALDGAPGIYSARFAGEPVNYAANNRKLLALLDHATNRRARFRTVLALAHPDGTLFYVDGRCEGVISTTPRGTAGFGYDPLFIPDGETRTFAEMPAEEKNLISHRARAVAAAAIAWADVLTKPRQNGSPAEPSAPPQQ
jgi:XTP/dITP diphosphohydrolase